LLQHKHAEQYIRTYVVGYRGILSNFARPPLHPKAARRNPDVLAALGYVILVTRAPFTSHPDRQKNQQLCTTLNPSSFPSLLQPASLPKAHSTCTTTRLHRFIPMPTRVSTRLRNARHRQRQVNTREVTFAFPARLRHCHRARPPTSPPSLPTAQASYPSLPKSLLSVSTTTVAKIRTVALVSCNVNAPMFAILMHFQATPAVPMATRKTAGYPEPTSPRTSTSLPATRNCDWPSDEGPWKHPRTASPASSRGVFPRCRAKCAIAARLSAKFHAALPPQEYLLLDPHRSLAQFTMSRPSISQRTTCRQPLHQPSQAGSI
jgi:hypothetical protein